MRYIADLHVHSHYSRATSKDLNLESLYRWARVKGINVVGTGDFTHPGWFAELKEKLQPDGNGFFTLKEPPSDPAIPGIKTEDIDVRFCLTSEISSIYKYGDRVRKNHNLVYAPDLDTVARINHKLSTIGNLEADGRPILGLPSRDLLEIVLETSERAYLVPAHIWTPWFSTLGSKAGYDHIDDCFRDLTGHLFAVETGLSSDPAMNWKLSALDRFTLISNSDAHSPAKLGREANVLDTGLSYDAMFEAFKTGKGFQGTYEFYPEEGKYHHDGHRKCNVSLEPEETKKYHGLCPVCGKPLTVGVLHRVEDLADRDRPDKPARAAGYRYIIPLPEVLGEIEGVGPNTKTVRKWFRQVISGLGNEFTLLSEVPVEDIQKKEGPVLAEAIRRIREDEVQPKAGYDGVFGVINVFKEGEIDRIRGQLGFFGIDDYKVEQTERVASPDISYKPDDRSVQPAGSFGLNNEQQKVAESPEGAVLVKAGPGTGKTHTLVEWIVHQIESGKCAAEEVLAVTFTNKAAEELRERLTGRIGDRSQMVSAGTFHALCWHLLRERYPELHTVYDASTRRMILQGLFPKFGASEISSLSKQVARYLDLDEPVTPEVRKQIRQYRDHLWKRGAVDLSGLIRRTVEGLEADAGWLTQLRDHFQAIAVDEFQDINPMQYQLVKYLAQGKSFLAIGDPDQAIYGFRGADVSLFFRAREDFSAGEIALVQNYRSAEPILKAAGALISHNELHSGARLVPNNASKTSIQVFAAHNSFEEADYILDQIKKYVGGTDSLTSGEYTDSGYSYGFEDMAVLFRTRAVGKSLFRSFAKAGIPVHFGDGTAFLSEPPFTILSNMLHLWLKPNDQMVLSDLLSEAYNWSEKQISSLLSSLNSDGITLFGEDVLHNISDKPKADIKDLRAVYKELSARLSDGMDNMLEAVEYICNHYLPESSLSEIDLLKKETLLALAKEAGPEAEAFLEQMQLNPYTDAGRIRTEGVHLLTFHAAKGLEFPVVFIAGAGEGITPILRDDTDIDEERRLFYVAMTRAKEELLITCSKERSRYGTVEVMEPSRFIGEIPEALKQYAGSSQATVKENSEQLGLF